MKYKNKKRENKNKKWNKKTLKGIQKIKVMKEKKQIRVVLQCFWYALEQPNKG